MSRPAFTVTESIAAITRWNPVVNAVLFVEPSLEGSSPTTGEPILVKDCIDVAGMPTTFGSSLFGAQPASSDSEVARKLRGGGYVIIGKSHLTEFCFGATGENVHFGDACNPWDPSRITGGSSSGSAAAVAAGMVRVAIASDTGGSTRVPAALCGVVGLRPTLGRISNRGALRLSMMCDTIGPVARTVRETADCFAAIAGFDPQDPVSIAGDTDPLADINAGVRSLRIGLLRAFYFDDIQAEVGAAVEQAAYVLKELGATIVEIDLEDTQALAAHHAFQFVLADVADARRDLMRDHRDQIGSEVRRRIELGEQVSGRDYAACVRAQWELKREFRSLFANRVDLLLTPTTPITAPLWADSRDMVATTRKVGRFTYDIGATGAPSMTIPCGFDAKGLPIGMQLVAPWGGERLLFRVGHAYEMAVGETAYPALDRHIVVG